MHSHIHASIIQYVTRLTPVEISSSANASRWYKSHANISFHWEVIQGFTATTQHEQSSVY